MHKTVLFLSLVFSFFIGASQPQVMWQVWLDGTIDRWGYSWGDEFSGDSVDNSKWLDSYPWGRNYSGTCYQEYMTPGQNYELENGILKLTAKRGHIFAKGVHYKSDSAVLSDGKPNLREWNYTSGMLYSKELFKHGMFEIRCKLPAGTGFWPAFWLFAGKPNEEIDIFEFVGKDPKRLHFDIHCPENCKKFGGDIFINTDFSAHFNTVMGQWDEDIVYWHLNGESFAFWKGSMQHAAALIANLGVANNKPCPFWPAPDETTPFPAYFQIDHIRVWNRIDDDFAIEIPDYSTTGVDPDALRARLTKFIEKSSAVSWNINELFEEQSPDFQDNTLNATYGHPLITEGSMFYNKKGKLKNRRKQPVNNPSQLSVRIFAYPETSRIVLEFEGKINAPITIALQDLHKNIIFSATDIVENKVEIDLSSLSKGSYLLRGEFGEKNVTERINLL
ncbi:MAG: family 16 glycosylhydrolase [Bacteroidales bacterium]|jgi:hypothetical protein|nr:family 16 glycosylhydrolase [Bacteroidales bacterium]